VAVLTECHKSVQEQLKALLVLNLPTFENKKIPTDDHFNKNGLYGRIPTKKEPIRMLGLTSKLPCH